eukprot:6927954-Ditylum_brightwellii.AAC.1
MVATEATPLACPRTILIPQIMHKRNISSHVASIQSLGRCDYNSDDKSMSDDGSKVNKESAGEEEINVMGPG